MNPAFTEKLLYSSKTGLPDQFIEGITEQMKDETLFHSAINQDDIDKKFRSSKNSWIKWDSWIAGIMHNMMVSANEDYFHYDLYHFDAPIQSTIYDVNDHYDWHVDCNVPHHDRERKLSISLLMNDDYEGGEIELKFANFNQVLKPEKGHAIIFPAWMPHKVHPVTKGQRYSLVAWMSGPTWR